MLNKIISITLLLLAITCAQAETIEVNPDHPDRYVVVKGDTLWDISGRFLTEPWRWPEIWQVNPQISDPHLIYPGDVVSLSYQDGVPILSVDRGIAGGMRSSGARGVRSGSGSAVKLSPAIREYDDGGAIPSIPIEVIRHFLDRPLVINNDKEMDAWPYIVSNPQTRLISGRDNRIYVRGLTGDTQTYSIYRKGNAYESNGKVLGYEALYVGEAVLESPGEPATLVITKSTREVVNGDRLLPLSSGDIDRDFTPRQPATNVDGSIISVVDGLLEIGQYQIVVLDVGESDGMETGNILGIFQHGPVVRDKVGTNGARAMSSSLGFADWLGRPKVRGEKVQLPDQFAGVLMIFRTYAQVSYGLVMEAYAPLKINDTVRNF